MIHWKVYKNGSYIGVIEYDYEYASKLWGALAQLSGNFYQLMPVNETGGL